MTQRVTEKQLDHYTSVLNEELGLPTEPWSRDADGKYHANIGHIHLSGAYGGWQIQQMMNEAGDVHAFSGYHAPARATLDMLRAMLAGVRLAKGEQA